MNTAAIFRNVLVELDTAKAREVWHILAPHLPQPADDAEALATIHYARTLAASMPLRLRAWSHRWLCERGLPSGLPDQLRPRAERMYPVPTIAVGVAVKNRHEFAMAIKGAMVDAVAEAVEDKKLGDHVHVKGRILEARRKIIKIS